MREDLEEIKRRLCRPKVLKISDLNRSTIAKYFDNASKRTEGKCLKGRSQILLHPLMKYIEGNGNFVSTLAQHPVDFTPDNPKCNQRYFAYMLDGIRLRHKDVLEMARKYDPRFYSLLPSMMPEELVCAGCLLIVSRCDHKKLWWHLKLTRIFCSNCINREDVRLNRALMLYVMLSPSFRFWVDRMLKRHFGFAAWLEEAKGIPIATRGSFSFALRNYTTQQLQFQLERYNDGLYKASSDDKCDTKSADYVDKIYGFRILTIQVMAINAAMDSLLSYNTRT